MKWILLALIFAVIGAGIAFLALAAKESDNGNILPSPTPSPAVTLTAPLTPTPVPTVGSTSTPRPTAPTATATTTAKPPPTATPVAAASQEIEEALGVARDFLTVVNNRKYTEAESYLSPELLLTIREKGFLYLEKEFGPITLPLEIMEVQQGVIDESSARVSLKIRVRGIKGGEGILIVEFKKNGKWTINRISNS